MDQLHTLTAIPPEIRLSIYKYLLLSSPIYINVSNSTSEVLRSQRSLSRGTLHLGILCVCKLFYDEARLVLLRDNVFIFLSPLTRLASPPLSASTLSYLRYVKLGPYQCTAKAANESMIATRDYVQSLCPAMETLSTRLWLVEHRGAIIDAEIDFAPVVDMTWIYDIVDQVKARKPVTYTMGILKTGEALVHALDSGKSEVDVYTRLSLGNVAVNERAKLCGVWASISTRVLVGLVKENRHTEANKRQSQRCLCDYVTVLESIEDQWKEIAGELDRDNLLWKK